MARFFLIALAALLILTLQISVLPVISWSLTQLVCLPLIFISFLALLDSFSVSLFTGALLGLLMDLYSPYFFGFYTIIFLLSIILIKFFHLNFFQHKNLGSLLIANLLSLIIFKIFCLTNYFLQGASIFTWQTSQLFFGQIATHCFLVVVIYFLPGSFSQTMKSSTIA